MKNAPTLTAILTRAARPTKPPEDDDARWVAVTTRDHSADGTFLTAVATTGIYCRPSCPARRPLRRNVSFFETRAAAEAAGYRPCRRCKPHLQSPGQHQAAMIAAACRQIETGENAPGLAELARAAGLSSHHFHRVFKAVVGVTPKAYAIARRRERIREQLPGSTNVTDAIFGAGFNSNGRFYAESTVTLGMTPTAFRSGGKGIDITFAVGRSTLGAVLVAASNVGICAVFIDDNPEILVRNLERRFPDAKLAHGDAAFSETIAKVIALVDAPGTPFDLPLDIRGTAFQHRVWTALQEIPPGSTRSYSEIAALIGSPQSVRAVASACAANAIAVAIPCHRVIGKDGRLTGYRWGNERKKKLLESETPATTSKSRIK